MKASTIHEAQMRVRLPRGEGENALWSCTVFLVLAEKSPQRVYGYFVAPPNEEWVKRTIEEWYGYRVEFGPWEQGEGALHARPRWEARVVSCAPTVAPAAAPRAELSSAPLAQARA
jgi:hypothetical protein